MQECFISELKEIQESYFENELVIEGEYATEAQMEEWGYSEKLVSCTTATMRKFQRCRSTQCCASLSKEEAECYQGVLLEGPEAILQAACRPTCSNVFFSSGA